MSSGGHSFHTSDWLKVAAAAAATALTAGAAAPLFAGTAAAGAGAGLLGGAAADTAAAGLGGGTAALFGPTAGGSALAAEGAGIPFITGGGAAGMGGGTASLFGGAGLGAAAPMDMFTAGLGSGAGGASMPTFMDSVNSGLSRMLPGGNDTLSSLKSGMGKLAKAQSAYQKASGLLGGPPQQGGGGAPPSQAFGAKASPVNFTQYTSQPNSMMPQQPQLPPQLAMLPPNDPRVLAYLQQMGGMNG